MLRAGPLSNTEVIELLAQEFVNAWVLAKDLEHREGVLAQVLKRYQYPVDSQVIMADGKLMAQKSAQSISMAPDPVASYVAMLQRALHPDGPAKDR